MTSVQDTTTRGVCPLDFGLLSVVYRVWVVCVVGNVDDGQSKSTAVGR